MLNRSLALALGTGATLLGVAGHSGAQSTGCGAVAERWSFNQEARYSYSFENTLSNFAVGDKIEISASSTPAAGNRLGFDVRAALLANHKGVASGPRLEYVVT